MSSAKAQQVLYVTRLKLNREKSAGEPRLRKLLLCANMADNINSREKVAGEATQNRCIVNKDTAKWRVAAKTLQVGIDDSDKSSNLHTLKPRPTMTRHKASQYDRQAFRQFLDGSLIFGLDCADSNPIFSDSDDDDDSIHEDNELGRSIAKVPEREPRQNLIKAARRANGSTAS